MIKRLSELSCIVIMVLYIGYFHGNSSTDYTPVLVELMCHLGDKVAMAAVRLLIDCAQLMGLPTKDNHTG